MKITLYYSPGACSLAPHIVLEELGVPHEAVRISTADGQQRSPEYLKINPRARVPALVVDGKVLVENVAILSFLGGGFPARGLWPRTTWDQAQALSLMAWLADTVHPAFAHFYRPERYVEGSRCVDAVKDLAHYTALVGRVLARPAVRRVMAGEGITMA